MEYDNNRPFSSEGAAQERKRKHALGKGVIIGVVATLLVVVLLYGMIEWTMHGYLPLDFFLIILFFSFIRCT